MQINWKQKLASRKFQCAVVVLALATIGFFTSEDSATQIVSLIVALFDVIAYSISESYVDGAREYSKVENEMQWCKRTLNEVVRRLNEHGIGGSGNVE